MMGGSEYQYSLIEDLIPPNVNLMLNNFDTDENEYNIHWQHQYFDQPSAQPLRDYSKINCIVFVSDHQKQLFDRYFDLPYEKSIVIRNSVEPFVKVQKTNNIVNLIYASTPFRGLDILLLAYTMLLERNKKLRDKVHLDIFSSMKLYGGSYMAMEKDYEGLYDFARLHPAITYHGAVERPVLRTGMVKSNLLAYPCTFEETSCCVAIEAMAAGVIPVVSNIGALPETCSIYGKYYSPMSTDLYNKQNKQQHALQYSYILENEILSYLSEIPYEHIDRMISHAEYGHNVNKIRKEWEELFRLFK